MWEQIFVCGQLHNNWKLQKPKLAKFWFIHLDSNKREKVKNKNFNQKKSKTLFRNWSRKKKIHSVLLRHTFTIIITIIMVSIMISVTVRIMIIAFWIMISITINYGNYSTELLSVLLIYRWKVRHAKLWRLIWNSERSFQIIPVVDLKLYLPRKTLIRMKGKVEQFFPSYCDGKMADW